MKTVSIAVLAVSLAAGCAKDEKNQPTATAPGSAGASTQGKTADCQEKAGEVLVADWEQTVAAYADLEFPAPDAGCEPLRLFTLKLAPLTRQFATRTKAIGEWSKKRSVQCRQQTRKKFEPRMKPLMTKMQTKFGPQMDDLEKRVRACKDHPGMAEAFKKASMRKAK